MEGNFMRKVVLLGVCVFLLTAIVSSFALAQDTKEPKELIEARENSKVEMDKAVKAVNARYQPKLEELKKQLTLRGDIKAAVIVEESSEKLAKGGTLDESGSGGDPEELKEIRKTYVAELQTAVKPAISLYLAKLEVVKQQIALGGDLKSALVVEKEIDKVKSSQENVKGGSKPSKGLPISKEELNSITWRFAAEDGRFIGNLKLMPGGNISGYSHENEARWGIEANNITFYNRHGIPSTRFSSFRKDNGKWIMTGPFLLGGNFNHVLIEVGR
jgi:hypothetical protein